MVWVYGWRLYYFLSLFIFWDNDISGNVLNGDNFFVFFKFNFLIYDSCLV